MTSTLIFESLNEDFFLKVHNLNESATWLGSIKNELLAANKLPLGYTACFPEGKRRGAAWALFAICILLQRIKWQMGRGRGCWWRKFD